jgi:hypothetical protein
VRVVQLARRGDVGRYHIVVVTIAALWLAACSSSGNPDSSAGSGSPSAAASAYTLGVELEPGEYTSQVFATPLTFTVPTGWKVFEDQPGQFGLARMSNDGPPLLVLRDIDGAAQCEERAESGVGRGAEDLTTWLAGHKGLVTTKPATATVGGLSGYVIDVELDPSWTTACPFSNGIPTVSTVVGSSISSGLFWGVDPMTMDRMWVLDLPSVADGNIVVIAEVCCGVDPADQLEADQQVVDTFLFDTTGG